MPALTIFVKKDHPMVYSIEGQRRSLKVELDFNKGELLFAGVSLPENTNSFFEPILKEFQKYLENPAEKTTLNFFIEYLNTSSALYLRRIVMLCEEHIDPKDVDITWHYEKDDDDIKEFGEDFKSIFKKVEIKLKEIEENPFD